MKLHPEIDNGAGMIGQAAGFGDGNKDLSGNYSEIAIYTCIMKVIILTYI